MTERFVVLGLARPRMAWFTEVARWATSAAVAADFVKAVSPEEVRVRLGSGRPYSALLVDGGLAGVDRDLFDLAASVGCAVIVVGGPERDWGSLGADAALPAAFDRSELLAALDAAARPVSAPGALTDPAVAPAQAGGFRAPMVTVTGAGGTGTSTLAIALAQGMAADVGRRGRVILADLCRRADQGLLHDARDVIPSILELAEAHRTATPSPQEVLDLTFDVPVRHYRLLLGLGHHRDWTALRSRSFDAALGSLERSCRLLVADVDDDFEGEAETGALDLEDRNRAARTALDRTDLLVVTGGSDMKGLHHLVRVVREARGRGVPADRIVAVVNRAPGRVRYRRDVVRTASRLLAGLEDGPFRSPVLVPEDPRVEMALRDGSPIPRAVVRPVTAAVSEPLGELGPRSRTDGPAQVSPVEPGTLGSWSDELAG